MSANTSQKSNIQHRFISKFSLVCLALMIALPFLVTYHMPPIASFFKEWLAALFGVLATLYLVWRNKLELEVPVIALVPLLLMLVLGLQVWVLTPDYWQNQFIAMLYLGLSVLLILLGENLKQELTLEKLVPTLAWAFVVGAILIMILFFIGKFIPEKHELAQWILNGKAGNVGQTNQFSNFIALGIASTLYLSLNGRIGAIAAIIVTTLLLVGLAQAGQRMAILYVLTISLGGWLLISLTDAKRSLEIKPAMLLWLIPGFIAAQLIVPLMTFLQPAPMPVERLASSIGNESTRLMLVEQGWKLFLEHPWIGAGWGEFAWYNFNLTEDYPSLKGLWSHTHNLFIQLLAETGLIGFGVLMIGAAYWFRSLLASSLTIEHWWVVMLLSVIGIHSMLEYPLWYVNFLAFTSLLLGLGSEKAISFKFRLAPVLFLAIFIFSIWSLWNLFTSYRMLESTLTTLRQEGLPQSEIDTNLETLFNLRSTTVFTPVADNFLVRVFPDQPKLVADKLAISQLVVENWPGRVETYNHAYYLALNNRPEDAQEIMRKAIKQFPGYRETFHRYLLTKAVMGEDKVLPLLIIIQDPYKPRDKSTINTSTQ